jgi:RNA polymerase sigma factor (TIGR02999 family)
MREIRTSGSTRGGARLSPPTLPGSEQSRARQQRFFSGIVLELMVALGLLTKGISHRSIRDTMPEPTGDITHLLREWRKGSSRAENELFDMVHGDLQRLAHYALKGERKGRSLQTTELVDQIYIRLVAAKNRDWQNRKHFFAIAGRAMRRFLIDQARARPGGEFIGFEKLEAFLPAHSAKVDFAIAVDQLLEQMEKTRPEWCNLVELKYFLGLTDEEAADVLGIKLRTMQRMWRDARQWMFERVESGRGKPIAN